MILLSLFKALTRSKQQPTTETEELVPEVAVAEEPLPVRKKTSGRRPFSLSGFFLNLQEVKNPKINKKG